MVLVKNNTIGKYLCADFFNVDKLGKERILSLIKKLAKILKMKIILGPYIVEGNIGNEGITAIAVIDKSHIAIHSFDFTKIVSVDIYSCKDFDEKRVIKFLKKQLGKDLKYHVITR